VFIKGKKLSMDRYQEMVSMIQSFEKDFEKFYIKGNKAAGIRLRKNMQTLRALAKQIRFEVQNIKDGEKDTEVD